MKAGRIIRTEPNAFARREVFAALTSDWQTADDIAARCHFTVNYAQALLVRLWRVGKVEREKGPAAPSRKPKFVYRANIRRQVTIPAREASAR